MYANELYIFSYVVCRLSVNIFVQYFILGCFIVAISLYSIIHYTINCSDYLRKNIKYNYFIKTPPKRKNIGRHANKVKRYRVQMNKIS